MSLFLKKKKTPWSSKTLDHVHVYSHIWPKTQSVMVRWGENWGIILVEGCNGQSATTTIVATLLPWISSDVLSSVTSCYVSAAPRSLLFLICFSLFFLYTTSTVPSRTSSRHVFCWLFNSDLIWREMKKRWLNEHVSCAAMVAHTSVFLWQAMYQLAPDEKRRDCGLNVLDTYFNNGVRCTYT